MGRAGEGRGLAGRADAVPADCVIWRPRVAPRP
jgi:hypothetical protein